MSPPSGGFVQRFAYVTSRGLLRDVAQPERPPGSEAHKLCYVLGREPYKKISIIPPPLFADGAQDVRRRTYKFILLFILFLKALNLL